MGCASSSPLVTANGGVLGAAKGAASDAVHAGEEALNDVKDAFNDTVGQVKEAVVGAVQNVGHGIENSIHGTKEHSNEAQDKNFLDKEKLSPETEVGENFKIIPLKDPSDRLVDEAIKEVESRIDKVSDYKDEAEKMADDLIKETEDVISETVQETSEKVTSTANKILHSSPIPSIDSLKTDSPEPEIEKALANNISAGPPTPKPTLTELEELHSAASSVISQVMSPIVYTNNLPSSGSHHNLPTSTIGTE